MLLYQLQHEDDDNAVHSQKSKDYAYTSCFSQNLLVRSVLLLEQIVFLVEGRESGFDVLRQVLPAD